jgi:hypothetical protein
MMELHRRDGFSYEEEYLDHFDLCEKQRDLMRLTGGADDGNFARSDQPGDEGAEISDGSKVGKQRYTKESKEPRDIIAAITLSGLCSTVKWRAKLYQLNSKGSWDDFGTGEFQIVREVRNCS